MQLSVAAALLNHSMNLVYIKVDKCASSTIGGVARRIGVHYSLGGVHEERTATLKKRSKIAVIEPSVFANHEPMRFLDLRRLRLPVFVFSFVRDPKHRCISSYFYFEIVRQNATDTPKNQLISMQKCRNFIFHYLSPANCQSLDCLFEAYDFIGVVEMWNLSITILAHLTQVPLSAVLSIATKIDPHPPLYEVAFKYLQQSFRNKNHLDLALYAEAKKRLLKDYPQVTSPISEDDQKQFSSFQAKLNSMQERANEVCSYNIQLYSLTQECRRAHKRSVFNNMQCDNIPKPWPNLSKVCYWGDNGCNYNCLDAFFGPP